MKRGGTNISYILLTFQFLMECPELIGSMNWREHPYFRDNLCMDYYALVSTEFDKFRSAVDSSLRDETQFIGVVAKNHDGYKMSRKDVHAYYTDLSGNSPDFHVVINGYHFIGLSASDNDNITVKAFAAVLVDAL